MDHGGGDLGGRQEAGVGHLEQQLRRGVILHQQGEGPIVRRARGGADPLGYLLLNQHRQGLKAAAFHHPGQQGGGDVIRQVGAQNGPQAPKVLPHQGRQLLLHHVAPDQGEIGEVRHGLLQHAGVLVRAAGGGNVPGHPALDEEVLTHGFGKVKAVAL